MDFDLPWLIDLFVLAAEGPQFNPEEFTKGILNLGLHETESDTVHKLNKDLQSSFHQEDSEVSDSIEGTFGRLLFKMAGYSGVQKKRIPLQELRDAFVSKLEPLCPVGDIFDAYVLREREKKQPESSSEKIAIALEQLIGKHSGETEKYDITVLEELKRWKPGARCSENVLSNLKEARKRFLSLIKESEDYISEMFQETEENRKRALVRMNRFFRVRKDAWEYIFEHIGNEYLFSIYLILFNVSAEIKSVADLLRALVNNIPLFEYVFIGDQLS